MKISFEKINRKLTFLLYILIVVPLLLLSGKKNDNSGEVGRKTTGVINIARIETNSESPDTNFTYEKYSNFLLKISDTSKYLVLPINEFRKAINSKKIVIGLRHDVDIDLDKAVQFSEVEKESGFRSTYFILHTADYYLANRENKAVHNEKIIPVLKYLQNESGFEIGWHNDLVTLQIVYDIDPVIFLKQELMWMRENGIKITGSASHGSHYCKVYFYVNLFFFNECTYPPWGTGIYINNITVPAGTINKTIKKGNFSDFDLEYEAYFLNNNKYYSDASFINGQRWDIGMLDLNTLIPGDRVIILLHPVHWHKGSRLAEITGFNIPGQISSSVNPMDSTVSVIMPYGYSLNNLTPTFSFSPGAYAKCFGSLQTSGISSNDFNNPVIYRVFSESRKYVKDWTVKVSQQTGFNKSGTTGHPFLKVYPNPSTGRMAICLHNITSPESMIEIINSLGERIYSTTIRQSGIINEDVDLSGFPSGIYIVKCSTVKNPVIFVLERN